MTYPAAFQDAWLPIAAVKELGRDRPLARRLMGEPLVVFQAEHGPAVFRDRCPHRNAALSEGRVAGGRIQCPYHGWRFAADGRCVLVPGSSDLPRARAETLPVHVTQGLVFTTLARSPPPFPDLPPPLNQPGLDTFLWPVGPSAARVLDAVENLVDPAHPHFLHPWMVRSDAHRRPVEVTVRRHPGHVEAIYREDARPSALMPRLLEGKRGVSIGRYFPPAAGQVAFEDEHGALKLAITVFFTPEAPDRTRPFAHFATPRGRGPAWLKEAILRLFHLPVLAQDQAALAAQAANIARFGGPRYALGPLDYLYASIARLAAGQALEPGEERSVAEL